MAKSHANKILELLYNNREYSDIIIEFKNNNNQTEYLYLNQAILCQSSPIFKNQANINLTGFSEKQVKLLFSLFYDIFPEYPVPLDDFESIINLSELLKSNIEPKLPIIYNSIISIQNITKLIDLINKYKFYSESSLQILSDIIFKFSLNGEIPLNLEKLHEKKYLELFTKIPYEYSLLIQKIICYSEKYFLAAYIELLFARKNNRIARITRPIYLGNRTINIPEKLSKAEILYLLNSDIFMADKVILQKYYNYFLSDFNIDQFLNF